MAWNSYMEWAQAFKNYLVRLTDTEVMVKEYAFEDILKSQTTEGSTQKPAVGCRNLFTRYALHCRMPL